jgi:hypothetical protein
MERKIHLIYPWCIHSGCDTPTPPNAILPLCDKCTTQYTVESLEAEEAHRLRSVRRLRASNEPITMRNIFGDTRYACFKIQENRTRLRSLEGFHEDDFNLQFFHEFSVVNGLHHFRHIRASPFYRPHLDIPPPPALINRSEGSITNGVLVVPANEKVQKVRKNVFRVRAGRIVKPKTTKGKKAVRVVKEENVPEVKEEQSDETYVAGRIAKSKTTKGKKAVRVVKREENVVLPEVKEEQM